jgi:hypothetical protein
MNEKLITENEVRNYINDLDTEGKFKCGECGLAIANYYYNIGLKDGYKQGVDDQNKLLKLDEAKNK